MKKDKYTTGKPAMFVDCNIVGRTRFYKDGIVKDDPKFSKGWKTDVKGVC